MPSRSRTARRLLVVAALGASGSLLLLGVVVTTFVMCGLSGCSGGGFGPSYSPGATQVLLLVCGAAALPAAAALTAGRPLRQRLVLAALAALATTVLTMVVTGARPDGCPVGTSAGSVAGGAETCVRPASG